MLYTGDHRVFACGRMAYEHKGFGPNSRAMRIMLDFEVQGVRTQAALDTGAKYLILDPEFAEAIGLASNFGALEDTEQGLMPPKLNIRGEDFVGLLHRVELNFIAHEGEGYRFEVTAFVPERSINALGIPQLLGYERCLDVIRFAIDGQRESFYFGSN